MVVMVGMGVVNTHWYVGMEVLNASEHIVDVLPPVREKVTIFCLYITTYYYNAVLTI